MAGDPRTVLIANPGADLYGSDRMAVESVRALVRDGFRVIVTVPEPGPLVALLQRAGADVVGCPTLVVRKGLLNARGLLTLVRDTLRSVRPSRRLLREWNPGTVIVNTVTPPLWILLGRLSRRKVICHVHEGEASVAAILRSALYLPLTFCHRILINSRFSLGVLVRSAPWLSRRTTVVYNAVAGPAELAAPRDTIDGTIRLLFVGRLSHRKGPHVAIDALKILTDAAVNARLDLLGAVFPGNEAYSDDLRAQVERLGLADRVSFLGFRAAVWDELAAHDIALIPSTVDEPFGNTAVEAALAARPAVVSAVGGLPEATAQSTSTVLVEPGDAEGIARAVRRIADDWTEYATRAQGDAIRVADVFSEDTYADAISEAVREEIGRRTH